MSVPLVYKRRPKKKVRKSGFNRDFIANKDKTTNEIVKMISKTFTLQTQTYGRDRELEPVPKQLPSSTKKLIELFSEIENKVYECYSSFEKARSRFDLLEIKFRRFQSSESLKPASNLNKKETSSQENIISELERILKDESFLSKNEIVQMLSKIVAARKKQVSESSTSIRHQVNKKNEEKGTIDEEEDVEFELAIGGPRQTKRPGPDSQLPAKNFNHNIKNSQYSAHSLFHLQHESSVNKAPLRQASDPKKKPTFKKIFGPESSSRISIKEAPSRQEQDWEFDAQEFDEDKLDVRSKIVPVFPDPVSKLSIQQQQVPQSLISNTASLFNAQLGTTSRNRIRLTIPPPPESVRFNNDPGSTNRVLIKETGPPSNLISAGSKRKPT